MEFSISYTISLICGSVNMHKIVVSKKGRFLSISAKIFRLTNPIKNIHFPHLLLPKTNSLKCIFYAMQREKIYDSVPIYTNSSIFIERNNLEERLQVYKQGINYKKDKKTSLV